MKGFEIVMEEEREKKDNKTGNKMHTERVKKAVITPKKFEQEK